MPGIQYNSPWCESSSQIQCQTHWIMSLWFFGFFSFTFPNSVHCTIVCTSFGRKLHFQRGRRRFWSLCSPWSAEDISNHLSHWRHLATWKARLVPWGGFHSLWKEKQGPGKGFSSPNNSGILLIHVALSCPWLTAHWISHQGVVAKFRAKVNTRICGVTGDGWTPTDRVV